jgi:hypothetical protein
MDCLSENSKTKAGGSDKNFVGRFTQNAESMFEAAEAVRDAGSQPTDMTIVIGAQGGIRMIADSDWPLESLEAHHGAQMVYRVSQHNDTIRLEGKAGRRTCVLESEKLNTVARRLLPNLKRYLLEEVPAVRPVLLLT